MPLEKRQIGMVFQNYALFPNMSVEQNVAFGLDVRRIKGAETALEVKIEKGRLDRFAFLLPASLPRLSSGVVSGSARVKIDSIAARMRSLVSDFS